MKFDFLLIGSGIMSTTLAVLLKRLRPEASILMLEAADTLSPESSDAWNNAGTGHAGICELSYTPQRAADGSVNVSKALDIFGQFEKSRQLWASAVKQGILSDPRSFVNPVPHVSFVWGAEQVSFLRARYDALRQHHFFAEMEYSEDPSLIAQWAPLLMEGRPTDQPIAATRMTSGTDVNFGALARQLAGWLGEQENGSVLTSHRVTHLKRVAGGWEAVARDHQSGESKRFTATFVFIGAGGGSLPLLQAAGVPEAFGYGGFPVGGQWLVCDNPEVVASHEAKVYGQALGAAPTMAVPHLDTRVIEGKKSLLFGPYASWTTKYLRKTGRFTDLPFSLRWHNLGPMLKVAMKDLPLVRYLIGQGLQSKESRLMALRDFYPAAKTNDWEVRDAGIRVQAITRKDGVTGIVHFGTEVLTTADKSMAALLGASPGASVSVAVMLDLIQKCLGDPAASDALCEMIPVLRSNLADASAAELYQQQKRYSDQWLQL